MDAECPACGKEFAGDVCPDCVRKLVEIVEDRRLQIINAAMDEVAKEADEVYAQDPTRGRGRGPKWMN